MKAPQGTNLALYTSWVNQEERDCCRCQNLQAENGIIATSPGNRGFNAAAALRPLEVTVTTASNELRRLIELVLFLPGSLDGTPSELRR